MSFTVQVQGGGGNGAFIARANITMALDEYKGWAVEQATNKLMLICEAVKVKTQKNLSKGTASYGSSLPGDFPHAITGRLRNSIFWTVDKVKLVGRIGTNLMYGLWLEVGTAGGRLIVPIKAKSLSWVDSRTGERRYARSVVTKGVQPRSFLRRTLVESTDLIRRILNQPMPRPSSGAVVVG